jgi:uncharacterized protein YxjI
MSKPMLITTYRIKEKFWIWESDIWIQNEKGTNAYKMGKKSFWSSNITVTDVTRKDQHQDLVSIRKPMISLHNDCYHIVRNSNDLIGEIKEKYIWLQAKHVFIFGNVEYVLDDSRWRSHSTFTMKFKGYTIAHVYKKMLDLTGSLWVDIDLDSSQYETDAIKEIHAVVLSACVVMIELLNKQLKKVKLQEQRDAIDKMPLQIIKSSITK